MYEETNKYEKVWQPSFLAEDLLTAEVEISRHLVLGQYNMLCAVKKLQVINHSILSIVRYIYHNVLCCWCALE